MKILPPALLLILLCPHTSAEIYSYTNEQGVRVFTDSPTTSDAAPLELPSVNRLSPAPLATPARQLTPAPEQPHYLTLRIESPAADAAIREGSSGNLSIVIASEPPLRKDDRYQLWLDGAVYGEPVQKTTLVLTNLNRGTHQLMLEILDKNGQSLIRSPSQPVHILRTSFAQKRAIAPCQKGDEKTRAECRKR